MNPIEYKELLLDAVHAGLKGGKEILDVYENKIEVVYKEDNSPLTEADRKAHKAIVAGLDASGIPVLSEEGRAIPYEERRQWQTLWIVDPLDGTKEFVKQNGEFTVNIALVVDQVVELGVIYVPVEGNAYFAAKGMGAFRKSIQLKDHFDSYDELIAGATPLPEEQERVFTMVGSRSHMSAETADYFEEVRAEHPEAEIISRGSSLKICMVAEGSADVYPRFAPTMEWDTAAGHAIVKEAGFEMLDPKAETPLQYNKKDLLNPWFIVK